MKNFLFAIPSRAHSALTNRRRNGGTARDIHKLLGMAVYSPQLSALVCNWNNGTIICAFIREMKIVRNKFPISTHSSRDFILRKCIIDFPSYSAVYGGIGKWNISLIYPFHSVHFRWELGVKWGNYSGTTESVLFLCWMETWPALI